MTTLAPDEFESRLRDYLMERAEESRVVRVGHKERSEQAGIVARYEDLFTIEQLDALREAAEAEHEPDTKERLRRLRRTCEAGFIITRVAPLTDALQNAEIAARVEFNDETLAFRAASARLATLPDYADREELGRRVMDVSAELNDLRGELLSAREAVRADTSGEPDPVRRSELEKGVSLRRLAEVLGDASSQIAAAYAELRGRWLERLLGPERADVPSSYHAAYVHRLSAFADVYTKDRSTDVCVATLRGLGFDLDAEPNVRLDLEDRPQKAPRPVVIPADPPAVVHLITRAQGGVQDYVAFLHEAGHALHFAGCDPALPYTFRRLARDNALTEIYSYTLQAVTREPGWHARHFGLSTGRAQENAEAVRFVDAYIFRRNVAKLQFELGFWSRFPADGGTPDGYADRLTDLTGFAFRPDRYLADMDADFYSADYLRAAIRSAQLRSRFRAEIGEDWWCREETGAYLRRLFTEGTRPTNEEIAERIGFDPLDVGPLLAEQTRA